MDLEDRLADQVATLRSRASDLRAQAAGLEQEANRIERQINDTGVEHVTIKPVQRGGELTIRDLDATMDVLEKHQPCSSAKIAEELGISQAAAVTRLTRLKQLGNAASRGITSGTLWSVGNGDAESTPSMHLQDHRIPVRDAGRKLGEFTSTQIHELVPDAARNTVARWCRYWVEEGVFELVEHERGHPASYKFVKVAGVNKPRPRAEAPENQVRRIAAPNAARPVPGTGRQIGAGEGQRTRDLIARVEREGGRAEHGRKHLKLYDKDGKLIASLSRGGSKTGTSMGSKATDKLVS